MPPNPTRSAASCISCAIGGRRGGWWRRRPAWRRTSSPAAPPPAAGARPRSPPGAPGLVPSRPPRRLPPPPLPSPPRPPPPYSVPIAPALLARNADEAAAAARPFLAEGLGVVVKILSPDIVHKSEVGGVRLNLTSERAVRGAVVDILSRARAVKPDARITGVT